MATPMSYEKPPESSPLHVKQPNIVIFMPDQLRYDSLSCTGNPHVKTPNIDAFASRGTLFTNCFTQAIVCSQSRCSIFTGQYPHVSGHRSLENLIKPWEPNLFRSLKERGGYYVACLAPRGDTFAPTVTELSLSEYGFLETPDLTPKFAGSDDAEVSEDVWSRLFYKGVRDADKALDYDEALVRSAIKWLDCPPKEPWVLFMPLLFPHCPFQVEEPYFSMYDRKQMPEPSKVEDKTGYEPRYMRVIREKYGAHRANREIWAEICATYYGMISRLDAQFGRVIQKLDERGLFDHTVTAFFTDHGEYLGDHGLIEKWPSGLSDSLVREPLIVGGANLASGKVTDAMTEMVDLVPTLFQLCGIGEHFPHNGTSMVPVLQSSADHKKYAFSEGGFLTSEEPLLEQAPYPYDIKAGLQHEDTSLVGKAISIRSKEWTYIYRLYEPAELYHRVNDPHELHNLAAAPEYIGVARMLETDLLRWMVETSDFLPWTKDPRFPKVDLPDPKEQYLQRQRESKTSRMTNGL